MIDANSQFFAILTAVGEAKQVKADAGLMTWKLTHMAVGDANNTDPMPDRLQKALINERRRAPLNSLGPDPANPGILVAEQIIPADDGGFWIRELGLFDSDGDLVAVANCAPSFKPKMSQGSGRTQNVRMNFIVKSSVNVVLNIDPAVVTATRKYVDESVVNAVNRLDSKQSVLIATTGPLVLAGVQEVDGLAVPAGSRVLVKNQTQAKDNGLYLVSAESWVRSGDADINEKVTPGLLVAVERGATNADTLWLLATDAPIALGTTALVFRNITEGFARLSSPAFTDNPTTPTPELDDSSKRVANTESMRAQIASPNQVFPVQVFRKNLLINGNFDVWQRGVSFVLVPANGVVYAADRWRLRMGFVGAATATRQAFALGQTDVPNEPSYFAQIVISGGGDLNFRQRIESVKTLSGKQVTVSFYAKADRNINVDSYLGQYFGTGGSPSDVVNMVQTINLTTAWQKFILTYSVPNIVGKALGSNGDDCLELLFLKIATNFTFNVAQVQLEEGRVATPFELRPLAHELALCQRYFEKSYNLDVAPGTLTRNGAALYQSVVGGAISSSFNISFSGRKRIAPAITTYNPDVANQNVRNTAVPADCSSTVLGNLGQACFSLNFTMPSGGSVNQSLQVHWTADAEL